MKSQKPSEVIEAEARKNHALKPDVGAATIREVADVHWLVSTIEYLNRLQELNPSLNWPEVE